jgi:hypothetical protein
MVRNEFKWVRVGQCVGCSRHSGEFLDCRKTGNFLTICLILADQVGLFSMR